MQRIWRLLFFKQIEIADGPIQRGGFLKVQFNLLKPKSMVLFLSSLP